MHLSLLEKLALYLTVFVTGASVMVIELLGTRLIAPFYGVSLYVWSSLISVTLIALALGYYLGGFWADRARTVGLSLLIALAALATLLIPWLTRPVLLATDPLGLRLGSFVSALLLFLPSLTLLAMVGPFAIKSITFRLEQVGNSVGSIYAVSTVGSVIGTLVLGFYLFPLVGSREILIGLALALLLLAAAVAVHEARRLGALRAALPCLIVAAVGSALSPYVADAGRLRDGGGKFRILSEHESLYGWVRVIEQPGRDLRLLTSDASVIGAASIQRGDSQLSYQDIVELMPALRPGMKRALIVGLGAGHMAKTLHDRYGIVTDTLEIDPAVAQAASEFFGFQPTGDVILGDARYQIRRLQGPYDLIIHDCFTGGSEPAHLLTAETLQQLSALLSPRGILAVNLVAYAQGPESAVLGSVAKTLQQVLPHTSTFISEPGKDFTDFIFLASSQPVSLATEGLTGEQQDWLNRRLFAVATDEAIVLTDNLNPIERLQTAKAERYRQFMVEMFGGELFVR
jgi:spermidine synthase